MFMMLYAGYFITGNTCSNLTTKFVNVPCYRQWPVHIPDTDFNFVLFSCCTFLPLLSMDPGSCPTNDMSDPFWQPHCLLPHIQAAGSVVPCFDLPLSQRTVSSLSLVLSEAVRSLQHSFIIQHNIHLSSVHGTHCSLH